MLPRIYLDIPCPLDGYDLTITLLANPTGDEKRAWWQSNLGDPSCAACAALEAGYCEVCSAKRHAFGQSVMVVFKAIGDCDLSTPAACVSTIERGVPDEIVPWLYQAPNALWAARGEEIKKKLTPPLANGVSSQDLPTVGTSTT